MLTGTAKPCRAAAEVFDLDPSLADESWTTGPFRSIELLTELARQLRAFLRGTVFSDHGLDRYPRAERWVEVEAMFARIRCLAERIPSVVPRRETATVAGMRAVSGARLAARYANVSDAAASVRAALVDALRVPYPDPRALELAELAEQLQRRADELDAEHTASCAAMNTALGFAPVAARPGA